MKPEERIIAAAAAASYHEGFGFCVFDTRDAGPGVSVSSYSPAAAVAVSRGWRMDAGGWGNHTVFTTAEDDVAADCGMTVPQYLRTLDSNPEQISYLLREKE